VTVGLRADLQELDRAAAGLLHAGGGVAAVDPTARRAARTLLGLEGALGVLSERALALQGRSRREAARAALDLASASDRVARALAEPVVGDEAPVALGPRPSLGTPLPAEEVLSLASALTQRSMVGRVAKVRAAVRAGRVRDLRLVSAWLSALDDPALGALVAEEVLPRLGPAVAGAVRESPAVFGGDGDARRLRTLVSVEGVGALGDLLPALDGGSPAVRAEALSLLGRVDPLRAFLRARALLQEPGPVEPRAAAASVLADDPEEPAVDCLLRALTDPEAPVHEAASVALGRNANPAVTGRLLALLGEPKEPPDELQGALPDRLAARRRALAMQSAREAHGALMARALKALGLRGEALAEVPPSLLEHPDPKVYRAARGAAIAQRHGPALERLAGWLGSPDPERRAAAVRAVFAREPAEAFERLAPWLEPNALRADAGALLSTVFDTLVHDCEGEDLRWRALATSLLREPLAQSWCVEYLASRGVREAVGELLPLLSDEGADRTTVLDALMRLGDGRAVGPILEFLERDLGASSWWALWALETLDDPSAGPRLEALAAGAREEGAAKALRELAMRLQRDRGSIPPGPGGAAEKP
jgi:HEAT repeat protein